MTHDVVAKNECLKAQKTLHRFFVNALERFYRNQKPPATVSVIFSRWLTTFPHSQTTFAPLSAVPALLADWTVGCIVVTVST